MENRSVLIGRLVADPELRKTPDGTPVTSFSIAVPRKFKKDVTDFLDIVAWRKNAEFLCQYFSKGKWVEADGSIQTRSYQDKEGKNRKAVEIVADEINFVGDKAKDEATPAVSPPPNAAQVGFDPFAGATPSASARRQSGQQQAPAYMNGSLTDFSEAPDDDGDLPF